MLILTALCPCPYCRSSRSVDVCHAPDLPPDTPAWGVVCYDCECYVVSATLEEAVKAWNAFSRAPGGG